MSIQIKAFIKPRQEMPGTILPMNPPPAANEIQLAAFDVNQETVFGHKFDKIDPNGSLTSYHIDTILRDPQSWENIKSLYELAAYYTHKDNILNSAVRNVLVDFSVTTYRLNGSNKSTREFLKKWFQYINLEDLLYGIYMDLYTYGNVFLYVYEDCSVQILPPHRIQVAQLALNGEPVCGYEVPTAVTITGVNTVDVTDLQKKYPGLPPEVYKGMQNNERIIRLDPERVFYIGLNKSHWECYAMPMIVPLLEWFNKKNLVNSVDDVELNNMAKSFLHVKVGNKDNRKRPNLNEFRSVANSFTTAVTNRNKNLAVTAWDVAADFVTCSPKDSFEAISRKLADCNSQILSGIGISPIIVCGADYYNSNGGSGSFSQVQANVSIANKRINQSIINVSKMLRKIMGLVLELSGKNTKTIPELVFEPVDLSTSDEAATRILKLFDKGLIGYQTVYEKLGYDYNQEKERRLEENGENSQVIFAPPSNAQAAASAPVGRPTVDTDKRKTDKNASATSNEQPKPSTM